MKNYLSTKRGSSRRPFLPKGVRYTLGALVGVLVLLVFVPAVVRTVAAVALYPFEVTRVWLLESSDSLPYYFRDRAKLVSEIDSLRQAVAVTEGSEGTIVKLQAENEQFRLLCEAVPDERIITRVVGRPSELPYDVLMIDRGARHGVLEAAPVFVGADQVIGYVSRVYADTSLVTLVTTADFESTAYIIGPNIYTFAEGIGGGVLRVRVPQGIPLQVGDTVILPAVDSGVYGTVSEVVSSPTQPEQYGYVPLPVSLQSMQYVSVGRQAMVPHSYEAAVGVVETLRTELFTINLPPGVLVTPETSTTTPTSTPTTAAPTTTPSTTVE